MLCCDSDGMCFVGEISVETDAGFVVMNQAFQATTVDVPDSKPLKPVIVGLDENMINNLLVVSKPKEIEEQEEKEKDPILLVCEEAHRYVPDHGEAQYAAAQGAIRRRGREGRKDGEGERLGGRGREGGGGGRSRGQCEQHCTAVERQRQAASTSRLYKRAQICCSETTGPICVPASNA